MAERGMGLPGATAGRLATVATMPITTDGIELYIQGMLQAATAANSGQRIACPCRLRPCVTCRGSRRVPHVGQAALFP
jgi:hypothetical protein